METAIVILVIVLIIAARVGYNWLRSKQLAEMPSGSMDVVTMKRRDVSQKVNQYTKAGWVVAQQSSAKSLGRQAQITITFKKP